MMKIIGSGVVSRGLAGDVRGAVTGVLTGFLLCCVAVPSLGHDISARMVEHTTALIDATAGLPQVINPGTLRYSFDDSERVDLDFADRWIVSDEASEGHQHIDDRLPVDGRCAAPAIQQRLAPQFVQHGMGVLRSDW